MRLSSPSFRDGDPLPASLTSDGANLSPALAWSDLPPGTRSLALLVEDADSPAPGSRSQPFTHWLIYNLQPSLGGLELGANRGGLPAAAVQGVNDFGRESYAGPQAPLRQHRYRFRLFALDATLPALGGEPLDRRRFLELISGGVLAEVVLMGWYRAAAVGTNPVPLT